MATSLRSAAFSALERIIQRDPGGRGIGNLIVSGDLAQSCAALAKAKSVAVLTGFPCLLDCETPTETDGPPGACAIAHALARSGVRVRIVTDECNVKAVRASWEAAASAAAFAPHAAHVDAFPPAASMEASDHERLQALLRDCDHIVAIERTGVAADGNYYTAKARDMSHVVAPLDVLFKDAAANGVGTTGIGDGGNELGMGKVLEQVRTSIPNGATVACVQGCDHLITCGVSNWGGYAIAAGLAMLAADAGSFGASYASAARALVPSAEAAREALRGCVEAGARDGISREEGALSVDGMPWERHEEVLRELTSVVEGLSAEALSS